jgi:hypothetical protein
MGAELIPPPSSGGGGGSGDMVLADTQTVTGAKTFANGALKQRNAAGTFSVTFSTSATENRTANFPDANIDVARTDAGQTFTGTQTFSGETFSIMALNAGDDTNAGTLVIWEGDGNGHYVAISSSSDLTVSRVWDFPNSDGKFVGEDVTQTLTNKRITPRIVTTTDDATAVIDVTATDVYELTAVANNTTFSTTGTPTNGQPLLIRVKDAGVSKTITWDAVFSAIGVTLPTATTAGKWHYVGCRYNSTSSKWDVLAAAVQA